MTYSQVLDGSFDLLKASSTWVGIVVAVVAARVVHILVHRLREYQVRHTSM